MFTLAIVGRPNVGKSTLFNRLAGKQLAIVHDEPGVTRDWRVTDAYLAGRPLQIIDTAGLEDVSDTSLESRMKTQTESALEHADAILFVFDAREGVTSLDKYFAKWLRKQNKPVLVAANKAENEVKSMAGMAEAYQLGLGEPIPMSAAHGHGLDDLYTLLAPHWPEDEETEIEDLERDEHLENLDELEGDDEFDFANLEDKNYDPEKPIKVAIVGRPNAGKSTLVNALLGEERMLTGPEAGITRDAISTDWVYDNKKFRLVDTAGMRKRAKIQDTVEKMSVNESLRAIRLAQIVVLMVDAEMPLEKQDLSIGQLVAREGRALVVVINKWDLIDGEARKDLLDEIKYRTKIGMSQVADVPIVTLSALKAKGFDKLMDKVITTYELWNTRVSTGKMNRWLRNIESHHPAPLVNGKSNRLRYITQIKTRPPTFALWCARPDNIPESYERYVINSIRDDFKLPSVPIRLHLRTSKNPYSD